MPEEMLRMEVPRRKTANLTKAKGQLITSLQVESLSDSESEMEFESSDDEMSILADSAMAQT